MSTDDLTGLEILSRLKSTDPPQWLAPNPSLSQPARTASCLLFSSLKPYAPLSPLDQLLIDGFDAEQIWQQIELQSQPLLSFLKREVRRFEKNPGEISRILGEKPERKDFRREADDGFDEDEAGASEEQEDDNEEEEEDHDDGAEVEEEEDIDEDEDEDEDEGESDDEGGKGGIEDGFLKIKELEEYLQKDEAREYGLEGRGKKKVGSKDRRGIDGDDASEEGEEDDGDDNELGGFGHGEEEEEEEDEDDDEMENARYQLLQERMFLNHFNLLSLRPEYMINSLLNV